MEEVKPVYKPGSVQRQSLCGSHSSRPTVTRRLKRPTREQREPRCCPPIWSCSGWGLPAPNVAAGAVRSYRTFSPLPDPAIRGPSAVYFLLHFPSPHDARPLAGIPLCGARTFLSYRMDSSDCPTDFTDARWY